MTSQFAGMTSLSVFLALICFSCQAKMLVQVSRQYHHRFWGYDNFLLKGIDQKSGKRKYPRLIFVYYLGSGTS